MSRIGMSLRDPERSISSKTCQRHVVAIETSFIRLVLNLRMCLLISRHLSCVVVIVGKIKEEIPMVLYTVSTLCRRCRVEIVHQLIVACAVQTPVCVVILVNSTLCL